ncbi:MAG: aminotransferase class V-fold PLP-dependent enzyme [Bacteroidetes bacterium]|nr:aminotransferase class V-fold PLP-dependent enzyme [bacterium]NBP64986.1 aminotransferase class V-fold PLP-dependent enzyme [Bacteroidota bacterium]
MLHKLLSTLKSAPSHPSLKHDAFFNSLREKEFSRLDKAGHVYLDYTGGNLYADSQLAQHQSMLRDQVFGNPHSTNPSSQYATKLAEEARQEVLKFFNAEDYFCIFTQNATEALHIVGECYPFGEESHFVLLADNHNSVNGIREYCKSKNGAFTYVQTYYEDLMIDEEALLRELDGHTDKKHKLFAFPGQSNVSGVKHDLSWIQKAQDRGWNVLLDAAAFAPTNRLDLKIVQPDFVSLSFYKIFGYPTGVGCLLVKKTSFDLLRKPWFAGGNVTMVAVLSPQHYLHENHERFENGTINYLDIPAVTIGLRFIESIGRERIGERIQSLMHYLCGELQMMQHATGMKQVHLYGPEDRSKAGGTVIMTFLNPDGSAIPFEIIEQKANTHMISLRSGCFCNPGIDEIFNCVTTEELTRFFSGRTKGNYSDMFSFLKKMRGAVRISVGLATTKADIDKYVQFVSSLRDTHI